MSDVQLTPLHDLVRLVQDAAETVTPGGIIIAQNAQEKPNIGTVQAIGPHVKQVQVGDRVIYGKYAGKEVQVGESHVLLVAEKDIIARFNRAAS